MKKNIIINTIIIFMLTFPFHFIYDLFPNFLTSIFFPVNESIFEHIKLIFTSILVGRIIIYFIRKKQDLTTNNYIMKSYLDALCNILLFLSLYLPIYYLFGENLFITLLLYLISIFITGIFIEKVFNKKWRTNFNRIGIILIIITYFIFTYFSYNPIRIDLFYDPMNKNYGILKK